MSERCLGLMWWIDRWRKSSAYMDMTLEEQGAYRNLLDEAWLRGGPLPNDERVLAKASGDATLWKRVRPAVMARFTLSAEGWRNDTLDDVLRQTERRVEKQKRYRDKRHGIGSHNRNADGNDVGNANSNAAGNADGNERGNEPGSQDPDPDESSTNQNSRRERARAFTGIRLKVSQAQHQVLLDELGPRAERLDLLARYAVWDQELVENRQSFDTLAFIKQRAAMDLEMLPRTSPQMSSAVSDAVDECERLHQSACGGSLKHRMRMLIDAEKTKHSAAPQAGALVGAERKRA